MNILIPVSWLREYLKTDVSAKIIAKELSLSGPSVERIEKKGEDYVFDIEVTTNRPDALSVYGIAREANAILNFRKQKSHLKELEGLDQKLEPETKDKLALDVNIKNYELCPHFAAVILSGIHVKPSPAIIKNRLESVGIRPINNIVDITNYLMIETGQPMHAFDFDKIQNSKMILRSSEEGESITTLDGQKRRLPIGSIVISDGKKLIDLCGIMGGQNSQITSRTKKIILFAQEYNPITIRKTTQALAFRTDASARFEKGIDSRNILNVLKRAVFLTKKLTKAQIASELIDIDKNSQKSKEIRLSFAKLNKYLNFHFDGKEAIKILTSLGFQATFTSAYISAVAPSWRQKDVTEDVDLIEEIARIYGYHNLKSSLPQGQVPSRYDSILKKTIFIKNSLKYLGFTEIISYSIISRNLLKISGKSDEKAVELANPLTDQWQYMRPTIIPSLLEVIAQNQNLESSLKIFEIAKTYEKSKDLPIQDLKIAFAIQNSDFSQAKGFIENLSEILKREVKFIKEKSYDPLLIQDQSANIIASGEVIGKFGVVNTKAAEEIGIRNTVAAGELNLTKILSKDEVKSAYKQIAKFPPVIEDISAIFAQQTQVADILEEIKKSSPLIKDAKVIDIFEDPKIGEDKKSITIRLTFQNALSTPSQDEVSLEKEKIIKSLNNSFITKIRK